MTKILMKCIECKYETTYYESWWNEVMGVKLDNKGNYLCPDCEQNIGRKSIREYVERKGFKDIVFYR